MADEPKEDAWKEASEDSGAENSDDDWAATLPEQESSEDGPSSQPADFKELGDGTTDKEATRNLDFLLDIPLEITVELGRTDLIINKMLQLTQGSVVELEKAAGEPVDIYVNKKLLGKGEVVVVNDRFGVRITEIISRVDRIKNIG